MVLEKKTLHFMILHSFIMLLLRLNIKKRKMCALSHVKIWSGVDF